MFSLILIILLVVLGLAVFLWIGTTIIQGVIYTEPVADLHWRAPAAAGAIGFFLLVWSLLAYASPGSFDTLFSFTGREVSFNRFWSIPQAPGGTPDSRRQVRFARRTPDGPFLNQNGKEWVRAESSSFVGEIIVETADGQKIAFRPELNEKGNPRKNEEGEVVYHEVEGNRTLTEGQLLRGVLPLSSAGLFWLNFFFNLFFLAAWFACLWLILHFQWPHALGLALVLWLVASFPGSLVSGILNRASELGQEPSPHSQPQAQAREFLAGASG